MPKGHVRVSCRICERHISECGSLSKRGKCSECAHAMVLANLQGLGAHGGRQGGPFFDHWRRRSVEVYGGVLLDDLKVS